jgi:hypothetical protein
METGFLSSREQSLKIPGILKAYFAKRKNIRIMRCLKQYEVGFGGHFRENAGNNSTGIC